MDHEARRQIALIEAGDRVAQETRLWDEDAGRTASMRSKEEAYDYRYFPEPDLVPVAPTEELRARVRATMPELPAARRARYVEQWGVAEQDARTLLGVDGLADFAERAVAAGAPPRDAAIWSTQDVLAYVNSNAVAASELDGAMLAEVLDLVHRGTISRNQAKDVLVEALTSGSSPRSIVDAHGLAQVSDEQALAAVLDEILATHAGAVADYRTGDDKVKKKKRGFLMGEAMKALKGQGNPQALNRLLDDRLDA